MGRTEIQEKLNNFLLRYQIFKEESQVVYLLVEIRKILEHENENKFKLLKFFCDWTVHTKKDRSMEGIIKIAIEIDNLVSSVYKITTEQNEKILKFFEMKELKQELLNFINAHLLFNKVCTDDKSWKTFVELSTQVLSGQPILHPIDTIDRIEIVSDRHGSSITIDFGNKRGSATAGFGK